LGLTTAEIARAFLSTEATIAQRIVRAKRKIVDARIPYRMPEAGDLTGRLDEILRVLYLLFNEGYLSTGGAAAVRRDLAEDAEWLTSLLARLLPEQPEAVGLLVLIRLHRARDRARLGPEGRLVLLQHQDRSLWDRAAITDAPALLEQDGSSVINISSAMGRLRDRGFVAYGTAKAALAHMTVSYTHLTLPTICSV